MTPEQVAVMFRKNELERRAARQKALLANEARLASEPLTEFDKKVHAIAIGELKQQREDFEKEIIPSYWRRLWRALLNK